MTLKRNKLEKLKIINMISCSTNFINHLSVFARDIVPNTLD